MANDTRRSSRLTGVGVILVLLLGAAPYALAQQDQVPPDPLASGKKGTKGPPRVPDSSEFDRRAAEMCVALADVKLASEYAASVLRKSFGFHDQSVSRALHAAHESFKQARTRMLAGPDESRRRVAAEITRSGTAVDRYIELVTKSIASAQSKNSWAGEPSDLFAQAVAVEPSMSWSDDAWRVLRSSVVFSAALPADERVRLGLAKDAAGFDLGVGVLHSETNKLLLVRKGGLAGKLGFEAGDQIASVDGKAVKSIWEFQQLLLASAGQRIEVEVERQGKKRVRKIRVPDQLAPPAAGDQR
jgi:hypothetical protein